MSNRKPVLPLLLLQNGKIRVIEPEGVIFSRVEIVKMLGEHIAQIDLPSGDVIIFNAYGKEDGDDVNETVRALSQHIVWGNALLLEREMVPCL